MKMGEEEKDWVLGGLAAGWMGGERGGLGGAFRIFLGLLFSVYSHAAPAVQRYLWRHATFGGAELPLAAWWFVDSK
jgi:hypothetical protein